MDIIYWEFISWFLVCPLCNSCPKPLSH